MPQSEFVYIQGEAIPVGSHGDHDYLYASGEPVIDSGDSDFVFESGTGVGGAFVMEGLPVGYFEHSKSHWDFCGYDQDQTNDTQNSKGWLSAGIKDQTGKVTYIFATYSTQSNTYGLSLWSVSDDGDPDSWEHDTKWHGLGGIAYNPDDPAAQDGPDEQVYSEPNEDDKYETHNGEPVAGHGWQWEHGDGVTYEFDPGQSFTVDIEFQERGFWSSASSPGNTDATPYIRARGPDDNKNVSFTGYGQKFTVEVNV